MTDRENLLEALSRKLWAMNWSGDEAAFRRKAKEVLDFLEALPPPAQETAR
jgi:hypothetical protein